MFSLGLMKLAFCILLSLVGLLGCSRDDVAPRPPSDAEVHDAFEAHVHRLVGNAFQRMTLSGLTRGQPTEEYVPEINTTVMTFPVSFDVHIETTQAPLDDSRETARFYRNGGKWSWVRDAPKT